MKKFSIEDKVFKTDVLFIVGCDQERFCKELDKLGVKPDKGDEYVVGRVMHVGKHFFRVVWAESEPELMHELFHLVVRICKDKGVPIEPNIQTGECGDETAAYLFEFYYREIKKRLRT